MSILKFDANNLIIVVKSITDYLKCTPYLFDIKNTYLKLKADAHRT